MRLHSGVFHRLCRLCSRPSILPQPQQRPFAGAIDVSLGDSGVTVTQPLRAASQPDRRGLHQSLRNCAAGRALNEAPAMPPIRLLTLLALLIAMTASAQQPSPLTEKIDVSIVNVDVTVTSRGEPVHGLTREDFEVFEDGVRQPITGFDAVEHVARTERAVTPSPAQPASERFRRSVLVIVDNRHITAYRRNMALARLESFIDDQFTGGEYNWSVALIDRRVRLFLAPTSDKQSIHGALDVIRAAKNQPFLAADVLGPGLPDELSIDVDTNTAIVETLRALATAGGKKIVLLLSTDLGTTEFSSQPSSWRFAATAMEAAKIRNILRDRVIHEANASNVNLYIINVEGLNAPGDMGGGGMTDNSELYWVARETGGRLMPGNDLGQSFQIFDSISSNFYSLAYKQPHGDDGKYHRIKVRLKRPGRFALQYRVGYSSIPVEVQMVRALTTTLSASMQLASIPLSATTGDITRFKGGMIVPIEARIPLKDLQFTPDAQGWSAHVDLYVAVFDADGRNLALQRFTTTASAPNATNDGDLIHNATVKLSNGKPLTIIVAVRDQASDAIGMYRKTIGF